MPNGQAPSANVIAAMRAIEIRRESHATERDDVHGTIWLSVDIADVMAPCNNVPGNGFDCLDRSHFPPVPGNSMGASPLICRRLWS
jgi:hypothetical protein